ncbi:MAG: tripartite tricarboxylate transporter substrate binding protein [Betaproteobacteria bacterium]|nr:MAG: tripartite tricarboxylate transporter substrate binding protein [Betaproteobacteria bacterium]
MQKRYTRVASILAAGALTALGGTASAQQEYPSRPIRFITPYAPGGSTSVLARLVGQHFTERWGQNVIVDNRPGGNTVIGTETLAKAPPDGYTIMLVASTHAILSSLIKTPYDPIKDFVPVAGLGVSPQVLVVHPGVPANTVQEFIALAKAKPGQLNFASSGAGGPTHLSGELFNIIAGVKTQHIPYKGAGPAMVDLIGGHVQMFYSVPINIIGHVKSGKLKAIAVTSESRLKALPQTPTFAEAGLPKFDVKTWTGVLAPAGTPRAIVDKLSGEIGALLAMPETVSKLDGLGMAAGYRNSQQFADLIRSEIERYRGVIKTANIRID